MKRWVNFTHKTLQITSWESKPDLNVITVKLYLCSEAVNRQFAGLCLSWSHKLLHAPLTITLPFFPSGLSQRALQERDEHPVFALLRWPKMARRNGGQGGFHKGQAAPVPATWVTALGWRQWVVVITLVVEQAQLWNLLFSWWNLQGRGTYTGSPLLGWLLDTSSLTEQYQVATVVVKQPHYTVISEAWWTC